MRSIHEWGTLCNCLVHPQVENIGILRSYVATGEIVPGTIGNLDLDVRDSKVTNTAYITNFWRYPRRQRFTSNTYHSVVKDIMELSTFVLNPNDCYISGTVSYTYAFEAPPLRKAPVEENLDRLSFNNVRSTPG